MPRHMIAPDQQRARLLRRNTVGALYDCGDGPVRIVAVAGDAMAGPHRIRADALQNLLVEQHLEPTAMRRILRPFIAGLKAARLGIDVVAVQADQRPFLRRQTDQVEVRGDDAEVEKLAHRVGLQIDADAEWPQLPHALEHDARHTDLMKRQRHGKAANTAAGDHDRKLRHPRFLHLHPLHAGQ